MLVVGLAALASVNPCAAPSALGCPDLVVAPPSHLRAQRTPARRTVLRMENRIVNVGAGPVELFGRRSGPREMAAWQVIADAGGVRRRYATGASLYYTAVPSRGGSYWKFNDAMRFELWQPNPADPTGLGTLVRVGPKLNYCLRDLRRVRAWERVPRRRVYGACNQTRAKQEATLGTSVGWADVYPAAYPGNLIDVTGLSGCHVLRHRVDPARHILESDETNNVSARVIRLPYRPGPQRCG